MNIQRKNSAYHFRMQSEREQTLVIITSYYNITIDTVCSQRLINRNIK